MRKYRVLAYQDLEGPDDLYEMKDELRNRELHDEGFERWTITDVQQLPRDPEADVSPVQNRFASVNLGEVDLTLQDGVVYVEGDAIGQYSDASEEQQNIIDEKLGENREWRQLNSGDE